MDKTPNDSSNPFPPITSLKRLAISESGFVFDPASGHNFTVNETGLAVLRLLQKSNELNPLLTQLSKEYTVTPRDLERDLIEFASVLRDYVGD